MISRAAHCKRLFVFTESHFLLLLSYIEVYKTNLMGIVPLTSYQRAQLLSVLAMENGKKSLLLIFKRTNLKEFAMLIMNHDNFMLRICIHFSTQSSLSFRWKQINQNNPVLFVYSHFLIFPEAIFIHKNGRSKIFTEANLTLSGSEQF